MAVALATPVAVHFSCTILIVPVFLRMPRQGPIAVINSFIATFLCDVVVWRRYESGTSMCIDQRTNAIDAPSASIRIPLSRISAISPIKCLTKNQWRTCATLESTLLTIVPFYVVWKCLVSIMIISFQWLSPRSAHCAPNSRECMGRECKSPFTLLQKQFKCMRSASTIWFCYS